MRQIIILFFSLVLFIGTAMAENEKTLFGFVEKATLVDKNLTLSAKMDTGAKSASLNAVDIHEIEIDDEPYIRFTVPTKNGPVVFQKKFLGNVKIKVRSGESPFRSSKTGAIKRPVVLMDIKLGNKVRTIKVNLTNRKRFNYPLLLGREAIIEFGGIIDPSRTFISTSNQTMDKK
ncbi:hypothetical protein FOG18_01320 [Legionella israelensis]|uniref:ATP-dependent zinc protease family protein n=1 Tax=Legionella israelensis TaxID=454 RepID=UPI0011814A5F|nr:RimK/LysX family protein [Legionella israelensis]QDP71310.1 hypothetical protein FOG18_01320 [Legionella israelensis]